MKREDAYKMYEDKVEHIAKLVWNEFQDLTDTLDEEPKGLPTGLVKYSTFVDSVILRILKEKATIVGEAMIREEKEKS